MITFQQIKSNYAFIKHEGEFITLVFPRKEHLSNSSALEYLAYSQVIAIEDENGFKFWKALTYVKKLFVNDTGTVFFQNEKLTDSEISEYLK
jgi:hypothetical protein